MSQALPALAEPVAHNLVLFLVELIPILIDKLKLTAGSQRFQSGTAN